MSPKLEHPPVLDPEAMARRQAGVERLAEMGVSASIAGIVIDCPDPKGKGASGSLADMVGLENARLTDIVSEIVQDAVKEGDDPNREVEKFMKRFAMKDDDGKIVRLEMPEPAQKKTLNHSY